jgi:mannose-6-phosphate isomerase-like protein (cupin superfamily)
MYIITEQRPWGKFEVLYDGEDCKLKRITVNPHGVLSLQSHNHRDEFWRIISGIATMRLGDDEFPLLKGDFIEIPRGVIHRVSNTTDNPLIFIELQTGDYFGEDDIIRYEDIYNRI